MNDLNASSVSIELPQLRGEQQDDDAVVENPTTTTRLPQHSYSLETNENSSSALLLQDRILVTSANHNIIHHWGKSPSLLPPEIASFDSESAHHHHKLMPPTQDTFFVQVQLLAVLLLTTLLAWFSAMDAKNHCLSHQAYAVYDMLEDEETSQQQQDDSYLEQQKSCKQVFRWVMIPVCTTTLVLGSACIFAIQRYANNTTTTKQEQQSMDPQPPRSGSSQVLLLQEQDKCRFCWKLLGGVFVIALAWSYGIVSVMLWPRYFFMQNNNNKNNPYQSLAAVDVLGHVSDNANLYYTSWLGVCLSIALVYQASMHLLRQTRQLAVLSKQQEQCSTQHDASSSNFSLYENVETMLSSVSASIQDYKTYRQSRATWYNSIYKLRKRTGIWIAASLATIVVLASSIHIYHQVLYPTAVSIFMEQRQEQNNNDNNNDDAVVSVPHGLRNVCSLLHAEGPQYGVPSEMCIRTSYSFCSAAIATFLQILAIVLHWLARHDAADVVDVEQQQQHQSTMTSAGSIMMQMYYYNLERAGPEEIIRHHFRGANKHIPLKFEFVLSVILSNLLGLNAVCCTSVQGPAAKVGNLYYASWVSFLLCLRICLGCLEELYHIEDEDELTRKEKRRLKKRRNVEQRTTMRGDGVHDDDANGTSSDVTPMSQQQESLSSKLNPSLLEEAEATMYPHLVLQDTPTTIAVNTRMDKNKHESFTWRDFGETKRANRLRVYFFLGIFSTVCVCAAMDSASNTSDALTRAQKAMIILPSVVSALSIAQFLLCLHSISYVIVSSLQVGGVLSVVTCGLCLIDLVLTMHSDSSWAVNAIGDIEMANLYYFTWASILTAGIQMASYTKDKLESVIFGDQPKDLMVVVWIVVIKVCFVIICAGLHVWNTISDTCGIDELQSGAVTFCSRTVFSILVGLTGIVVASLAVVIRLLQLLCLRQQCCCDSHHGVCCSRRLCTRVEVLASLFLVALFGVALCIITGIGGPGQSVGDMYYATWLAFVVSIGVGVSCYGQIKQQGQVDTTATLADRDNPESSMASSRKSKRFETPFVSME